MSTPGEQLERLFRAYRDACPDPEASPEFLPGIWTRIDARRQFVLSLRRWTSAFVTAAVAMSVAMAVYLATPQATESPLYTTTYVEVLESGDAETTAYAELVSFEPPGDSRE